jgi:phage FluMu gp28-like protein
VREDLHAMQQVVTNGQYNYWAPRTREGHSDRCTALALAVRAAGTAGGAFAFQSLSSTDAAHSDEAVGGGRRASLRNL